MDLADLRADIPALDGTVYLNTGAAGPSPRRVVEAVESELEYHEYDAFGGEGTYPAMFDAFDETRAAVADHLGAPEESVALTQSTTDGIGRVAAAMDFESGDVVVRTDQEHAAGILPWQRLEREVGIEVRVVEAANGDVDRDAFAEAVADAKLALFSSLNWTDGSRMPVTELTDVAHDSGARVLVDAVQSVGQHPVDVESWGVDAVAAAGHKWLLAPTGTGFLYVADEFARALEPVQLGYRSLADFEADPYELHPDARRFEVGTASPAPYAGLREGIAVVEELGYDAVTDRIERLTDRLKDGVDSGRLVSAPAYESGLVTLDAEDPEGTVERLAESDIVVRDIPGTGTVRVSVHAFNTADDVDALLDAL
mgnify:CR=1 FL=1